MPEQSSRIATETPSLAKCPTGISGLDDITHGGVPLTTTR
jgi:hypothetical protein